MDLLEKIKEVYMEGIHYGRFVDYRAIIEEIYWAIRKGEIIINKKGCD